MIRSLAATCFALALVVVMAGPVRAQAPAAPAAPTAADVAAFLGDWTLTMQSQMGPMAMALSIKTEAAKVTAEISSDQMPKTPIADITKDGTTLVLRYSFDYQGQPIPVAVTLAPAGEKINASVDFAGGAFQMSGTAAKVVKP